MLNKTIYQHYGMKVKNEIPYGKYEAFRHRNLIYIIVPIDSMDEEELRELAHISEHIENQGDIEVATCIPNLHRTYLTKEGTNTFILLKARAPRGVREVVSGRNLASFHQKGKSYPHKIIKCNRIGQWKNLWEKRLDQMELFWKEKVKQQPQTKFEKIFLESFPYYVGLTENAIQYLVDTELDEVPRSFDSATVCQKRFESNIWEEIGNRKLLINWVYDHPSRDLSEWMRQHYIYKKKSTQEIQKFMNEYESVEPLTPFAWRLLYARLLFPVHYLETVEEYYLTDSIKEKERLEKLLEIYVESSSEYERSLAAFFLYFPSVQKGKKVPKLEWLEV